MRFAFPDHLIDLNRIRGRWPASRRKATSLRIGAMTRQRDLLDSALVRQHVPLLTEALALVGHRQTRNRGTIAGSLCHLDPAAELVCRRRRLSTRASRSPAPARQRDASPMAEFPLGLHDPRHSARRDGGRRADYACRRTRGHGFLEFGPAARRFRHRFGRRDADAAMPPATSNGCSFALGGLGAVPLRQDGRRSEHCAAARPADALFAQAAAGCATVEAMDDPQVPAWYRRTPGARPSHAVRWPPHMRAASLAWALMRCPRPTTPNRPAAISLR